MLFPRNRILVVLWKGNFSGACAEGAEQTKKVYNAQNNCPIHMVYARAENPPTFIKLI